MPSPDVAAMTCGAIGVWESVRDLINAGTPVDGIRYIAEQNIQALRDTLVEDSVNITRFARFERIEQTRE